MQENQLENDNKKDIELRKSVGNNVEEKLQEESQENRRVCCEAGGI